MSAAMFAIFGFSIFIPLFGAATVLFSEKCAPGTLLDARNRDDEKPTFPLQEDPRLKPSNILKAHEILRIGLQQYLEFREEDLGFYLNHIVVVKKRTFKDEYGQDIRSYYKVFKFIWVQYNETLCQNYASDQYDIDKLDLCSVARFLSHQTLVIDRGTIMKKMGDALGYKCHPCTPYKRKEHGGTVVPNTDDIGPIESISPEHIFILCKHYDHKGQLVVESLASPATTTPAPATTPNTITTMSATTLTTPEIVEAPVQPTHSPLDYTPCSYSNGDVVCNQVPLEEVKKVFKQTSFPRLASVKLTLQPYILREAFIPRDIFGTKKILDICIQYPLGIVVDRFFKRLQADINAFQSTKGYTTTFTIDDIDCTLLDLSFLSGFEKLTKFWVWNIDNIQHCLPSLPTLPRLTKLYFKHCSGLNKLDTFPTLTNGLVDVRFFNDESSELMSLNDETVDRIMDWLLLSSANTLEELRIVKMSQVTRVPHKIASFKALKILRLNDNNISAIKSGAFSFSVPVTLLRMHGNRIKDIEPGAFKGDFKDAEINLTFNNLTRFEESVFGPILQQMASGNGYITRNPIDCSEENICHLAWLRSFKACLHSHLNCSNGTSIKDLQPVGFNHCL